MRGKWRNWFKEFSISIPWGVVFKFGPPTHEKPQSTFSDLLKEEAASLSKDNFWILVSLDKRGASLEWTFFSNLASKLAIDRRTLQRKLDSLEQHALITGKYHKKDKLWKITEAGRQVKDEYARQNLL